MDSAVNSVRSRIPSCMSRVIEDSLADCRRLETYHIAWRTNAHAWRRLCPPSVTHLSRVNGRLDPPALQYQNQVFSRELSITACAARMPDNWYELDGRSQRERMLAG